MLVNSNYPFEVRTITVSIGCRLWRIWNRVVLSGVGAFIHHLPLGLKFISYPKKFFCYPSNPYFLETCHPYLIFFATTNTVATCTVNHLALLVWCSKLNLWIHVSGSTLNTIDLVIVKCQIKLNVCACTFVSNICYLLEEFYLSRDNW